MRWHRTLCGNTAAKCDWHVRSAHVSTNEKKNSRDNENDKMEAFPWISQLKALQSIISLLAIVVGVVANSNGNAETIFNELLLFSN